MPFFIGVAISSIYLMLRPDAKAPVAEQQQSADSSQADEHGFWSVPTYKYPDKKKKEVQRILENMQEKDTGASPDSN